MFGDEHPDTFSTMHGVAEGAIPFGVALPRTRKALHELFVWSTNFMRMRTVSHIPAVRVIASSGDPGGEDRAVLLKGVDILAFWDIGGSDGEFSEVTLTWKCWPPWIL